MPLYLYLSSVPQHDHEKKSILSFVEKLRQQYDHSDSFCYLFINYQCGGKQIDATLIRENAIIHLEFKAYSAKRVVVTHQGDLLLEPEGKRIGEGRENPLQQINAQNTSLINFLNKHRLTLFGEHAPNPIRNNIGGFIILDDYFELCDDALDKSPKRYFQITNLERAIDDLSNYKLGNLHIQEQFVINLANLLSIRQVSDIYELFHSHPLSYAADRESYLKTRDDAWIVKNYIHRPEIENKLNEETKTLLIGAPGSGKSSLQKMVLLNHAKRMQEEGNQTPIPCFLNLVGTENILERIASELGISDIDEVRKWLRDGQFWIAFDGIDEIVNFRDNFQKIARFIELYSKNKYSISVRRELNDSDDHKDFFKALDEFKKLRVDQLSIDDRNQYIQKLIGAEISSDFAIELHEFISNLPDSHPLTIKMAIEVFKYSESADKPLKHIYENKGKFYQAYFKNRITRERQKYRFGTSSEVSLLQILSDTAKEIFVGSDSAITLKQFRDIIKTEMVDEPSKYIELFLNAEIIKNEQDERIGFWHQSYYDFFLALSLSGRIETAEQVEQLVEAKKYDTLVYICGIENDRDRIDLVISNAKYIDIIIDCLCNSSEVAPYTTTKVINALIDWIEQNELPIIKVFPFIIKYGARICGEKKLFDFLEEKTLENILHKLDWEIIKSDYLNLGQIEPELENNFHFSIENGLIPDWAFEYDYEKKTKDRPGTFWKQLVKSKHSHSKESFAFYRELIKVQNAKDIFPLFLNVKYPVEFRALLVQAIIDYELNNGADEQIYSQAFEFLKTEDIIFSERDELFNWAMVTLAFDCPVKVDSVIQEKLTDSFWNQYTVPVQLKMLAFSIITLDVQRLVKLCCNVLFKYENNSIVDLARIDKLAEDMFHSSYNTILHGDDPIAGEYYLQDFEGETNGTLLKCVALDRLGELKEDSKLIQQYCDSPNKKIKSVASFILGIH